MRKYRLLLLALIITGSLFSTFHHHENGYVSEDCQICIVQNLFSSADIPKLFVLQSIVLFFFLFVSAKETSIPTACLCSYPSRAPPSVS